MTILTSCGGQRALTRFIGLAIAGCAMASILMGNSITLVIPPNLQGQGAEQIVGNVGFGNNYPPQCYSGFGAAQIGPTCTLSEVGKAGLPNQGAMSGTATAYQDAAGLHALVDLGASGTETSYAEALSYYTDTLTNSTFAPESFQLGFHVDANLSASGSGAFSWLEVQFFDGLGAGDFSGFGGPGAAPGLQTWSYAGNEGVNLNALTIPVTVAPGASYTFTLTLDADVNTIQEPGTVPLGGPPTASVDALNTLTITAFTAQDSLGNPLPASDFSSSDGANYSSIDTSIDTSSAPEPGTFVLCGGFLVLLGVRRRPRSRS